MMQMLFGMTINLFFFYIYSDSILWRNSGWSDDYGLLYSTKTLLFVAVPGAAPQNISLEVQNSKVSVTLCVFISSLLIFYRVLVV